MEEYLTESLPGIVSSGTYLPDSTIDTLRVSLVFFPFVAWYVETSRAMSLASDLWGKILCGYPRFQVPEECGAIYLTRRIYPRTSSRSEDGESSKSNESVSLSPWTVSVMVSA